MPFFFHMRGDAPFVMAGLWDRWGRGDQPVETCTVITTDASSFAARYHHRMPALLTLDDAGRWVDGSTPLSEALALLKPFESADLECHEVSRFVNSPANDSPECIQPVSRLV